MSRLSEFQVTARWRWDDSADLVLTHLSCDEDLLEVEYASDLLTVLGYAEIHLETCTKEEDR